MTVAVALVQAAAGCREMSFCGARLAVVISDLSTLLLTDADAIFIVSNFNHHCPLRTYPYLTVTYHYAPLLTIYDFLLPVTTHCPLRTTTCHYVRPLLMTTHHVRLLTTYHSLQLTTYHYSLLTACYYLPLLTAYCVLLLTLTCHHSPLLTLYYLVVSILNH